MFMIEKLIVIKPIIFLLFYSIYKYVFPRSESVDVRHLTVDKYVLPDIDAFEESRPNGDPDRVDSAVRPQPGPYIYQLSDIERQTSRTAEAPMNNGKATVGNSSPEADDTESEDMDAEEEAQRAQQRERQHILEVLEERPTRRSRSFLREVWSFIVSD